VPPNNHSYTPILPSAKWISFATFFPTEVEIAIRSPGSETDSIDVEWRLLGEGAVIQRVFITATYTGHCTDIQLPPKSIVLSLPTSDTYTITGLQEFGMYRVNVTLITPLGRGEQTRVFTTKGAS
jgi:hypothetical protein